MASDSAAPIVVYDACVLYPFSLRNALLQCAGDRLVQARWTRDIHDEWIGSLLGAKPRLTSERLERTRDLMDRAVPDALVTGHHRWIPALSTPDPGDRHVVAAAIEAKAAAIVSADRHFRDADLEPHGLTVRRPNEFLMGLYHADPDALVACMANARRNLSRTRPPATEFIGGLRRTGKLGEFCDALEQHLEDL